MVVAAVLGVLSFAMLQTRRNQSKISSKSLLDLDFARVDAQIRSALTSPNDCNANFFGQPLTDLAVPAFYACKSGLLCNTNVATVTANREEAIPVLTIATPTATDASWDIAITKISSKIRITKITYSVSNVSGPKALSTLDYAVDYQTRLEQSTSATLKNFTKHYYVTVVVDSATSKIEGCPKSWNSIEVY